MAECFTFDWGGSGVAILSWKVFILFTSLTVKDGASGDLALQLGSRRCD